LAENIAKFPVQMVETKCTCQNRTIILSLVIKHSVHLISSMNIVREPIK